VDWIHCADRETLIHTHSVQLLTELQGIINRNYSCVTLNITIKSTVSYCYLMIDNSETVSDNHRPYAL